MTVWVGLIGLLLLAVGGYIAGVPVVTQALPLSPILIGAFVTALWIAVRPRGQPLPVRALLPVIPLCAALSLGIFFTDTSSEYASNKVTLLATLTPLALVGGAVLLQTQRAVRVWLTLTVTYAALIGGLLLLAPSAMVAQMDRLAAEGQNTIAAGRAPGAAVVVLVVLALVAGQRNRRLVLLAAGMIFAGLMLAAGSRGPLAACLLAVAATAIALRTRGTWAWLLLASLGGMAAWQWVGEAGYLSSRLTTFADTSSQARIGLYSRSMDVLVESPLGIGWGGLQKDLPNEHRYPHNIFLEIGAEAGWLALVVFIWFVGYALRAQWRVARNSSTEAAVFALTIFFLSSALVSGDINSHRALWVMLGCCLAAQVRFILATNSTQRRETSAGQSGQPTFPPQRARVVPETDASISTETAR